MIILLILLIIIAAVLSTPQGKGWLGEFRIRKVLGKTNPGSKYIVNDLKLRISDDKTSQIDHIVINKRGVFVIETKNYSGRIYGRDDQREWVQVLNYGKVKNKFYNPLKQNNSHVYHISNILGNKYPVFSAVVFVKNNIRYIDSKDVYTIRGLRNFINSGNTKLSPDQMEDAYNKILSANDKTITRSEHIKNIHLLQDNISNNICPRCGKKLVVRKGRNGSFMGCEGYPSCKFTKNI